MSRKPTPFAFLSVVVLALAVTGVGCPCSGVVNNSESLRWWLFSNFGASKVCPEMQKRGMPLKLAALGSNSVGRFFPVQCQVQVNDQTHTMAVTVNGSGYALLPVARRVGFYAAISVEYRPDFRMEDDAIWVWGRFNRQLTTPDLRILGVENKLVSLATQTPLGDVGTLIGQGVVTSELARGFTVVHQSDGDDFALGELHPPQKPPRPFTPGKDHTMLATDVTEIHAASRDYLGPFNVDGNGAALFVRLHVTGANLDYVVVDKGTGDLWRQSYEAGQPIGPAPMPPIAYGNAPIGDSQRAVPLNPGLYYVVVENRAPSAALGIPMPFESIGYATYAVELGDRP